MVGVHRRTALVILPFEGVFARRGRLAIHLFAVDQVLLLPMDHFVRDLRLFERNEAEATRRICKAIVHNVHFQHLAETAKVFT